MNRRTFISTIALTSAWIAALRPQPLKALSRLRNSRIDVATILAASFESTKRVLLDGRPWVSDRLNKAQEIGDIKILPLGAILLESRDDGDRSHEIQQIGVPLVWTKEENVLSSENDRIDVVERLIVDGIDMHEDLLLCELDGHRLYVSSSYRLHLGPIRRFNNDYSAMLYTAFGAIPKELR
jgi:hypothetical protein